MQTSIRKWGNSAGAIIPAAILKKAGFELDDKVDVDVIDGRVVLSHVTPSYTLEQLLGSSPINSLALDDADRAWLDDAPVGKEVI
jgi:antitoxin component of MazEF toxin-antitoxin module